MQSTLTFHFSRNRVMESHTSPIPTDGTSEKTAVRIALAQIERNGPVIVYSVKKHTVIEKDLTGILA